MLSESLSALCRITSVILEEESYLLARVDVKGSPYIAEVVPKSDDPSRARIWPAVPGILRPSHDNRERTGFRILLYKDSGGRFLSEKTASGPLSEDEARSLATSLSATLRSLHTRGFVVGYIGPECIWLGPDGNPLLLAGVRGVPRTPFAPPEALAGPPVDPRTDIFALGTLMFRAVAGSDDREEQLAAWGRLSPGFSSLVERMVAEKPENRHASMAALIQDLTRPAPELPPVKVRQEAVQELRSFQQDSSAEPERRAERKHPSWVPFAVVGGLALAAALFVLFSPGLGPSQGSPGETDSLPPTDSLAEAPFDSLSPDTVQIPGFATPSETVVWVSNCTGTSGAASDFRSGPASSFAQVYASSGAGVRDGSILFLRRSDIGSSLSAQFHWQVAQALCEADTSLEVQPVDMTVLLGRDLSYPGLAAGVLSGDSLAADTVYVEVVNQGLQYTLDGSGPAAWLANALDGKQVTLGGNPYIIQVADIRDGDRTPNEDTGVPALLDSTLFLYRSDSGLMSEFEGRLRSYVQALPDEVSGPPQDVPVPDIWILLGGHGSSS
jgi:hypothetical protein